MQNWLFLSSVALVFFGITGVTQKLSTNHISFELSFLWFCIAMVVMSILVAILAPLNWSLTTPLVTWAAVGGILNGLGALTSFAAFEKGGKASVVIPIINLYPLVTIGGAWLFLGEKVSRIQVAGIACALAAIVLLSYEKPSST